MARPIIALLSDFGTRDHYVGTMKAVVLAVCPDVTLVDLTHDIPAHDVMAGALELAACFKYFPAGTVFLVVVDPGVGSARRGLAADVGDFRFVAPDNGVLTAVFHESAPRKVVELTERKYQRPTVSRTFEGRDRFAPAAGWLAKGIPVSALGRVVTDVRSLAIPRPDVSDTAVLGEVWRVDRFGNLITNLDRRTFERFSTGAGVSIALGECAISRVVGTYEDAQDGEVVALFGSTDHMEIAVRSASAAAQLGLGRGTPLVLRRT